MLENTKQKQRKGGKLEPLWHGPYTINRNLGKGLYELSNTKGLILKKKANIARLKVYRTQQMTSSTIPSATTTGEPPTSAVPSATATGEPPTSVIPSATTAGEPQPSTVPSAGDEPPISAVPFVPQVYVDSESSSDANQFKG